MTLFEAYQEGLKQLKNPDLEEINLRILLCENNRLKTMSDFYIHKGENVRDLQRFRKDLQRFLNGEPIQYILQKATFFGDDFYISKDVLIPRNETEEVVDFAIKKIKEKFGTKKLKIVDVCCGSGCIGCEVFKNGNVETVFFSDISEKAVAVTKQNMKNFNVTGNVFVSDALDFLDEKVDVVLANPPYILNKKDVDQSVLEHEPHIALFVDEELTIYRKIVKKGVNLEVPLMIFEIGYDLNDKITKLFKKLAPNYKIDIIKDINKNDRICSLEKIL